MLYQRNSIVIFFKKSNTSQSNEQVAVNDDDHPFKSLQEDLKKLHELNNDDQSKESKDDQDDEESTPPTHRSTNEVEDALKTLQDLSMFSTREDEIRSPILNMESLLVLE